MSDRCEAWALLADREALGETLRDDERTFLAQHAASCPLCAAEQNVWSELGSLMGEQPPVVRTPPSRWPSFAWAAAAALLLLVAGRAGEHAPLEPRALVVAPVVEPLLHATVTEANDLEIDGKPAQVGDDVPVGATLFAREGSACLNVEPGVRVCATAGSLLRMAELNRTQRRLELRGGKLVAELDPQPEGSSFGVLTRDGAAIAIGTAFSVELPARGAAITRVLHGTVLVRNRDGREQRVTAHRMTTMNAQSLALPAQDEQLDMQLLHPQAPPAAAPVRKPELGVARERPSAFALLTTAREERARGDQKAALASYRSLLALYADSPEAHTARVPYAEILLSEGNPLPALRAFEQYLERGGALAEEASFGRVRALRALSERDDEAKAISRFLQTYPTSPLAEALRQRAQELGLP